MRAAIEKSAQNVQILKCINRGFCCLLQVCYSVVRGTQLHKGPMAAANEARGEYKFDYISFAGGERTFADQSSKGGVGARLELGKKCPPTYSLRGMSQRDDAVPCTLLNKLIQLVTVHSTAKSYESLAAKVHEQVRTWGKTVESARHHLLGIDSQGDGALDGSHWPLDKLDERQATASRVLSPQKHVAVQLKKQADALTADNDVKQLKLEPAHIALQEAKKAQEAAAGATGSVATDAAGANAQPSAAPRSRVGHGHKAQPKAKSKARSSAPHTPSPAPAKRSKRLAQTQTDASDGQVTPQALGEQSGQTLPQSVADTLGRASTRSAGGQAAALLSGGRSNTRARVGSGSASQGAGATGTASARATPCEPSDQSGQGVVPGQAGSGLGTREEAGRSRSSRDDPSGSPPAKRQC